MTIRAKLLSLITMPMVLMLLLFASCGLFKGSIASHSFLVAPIRETPGSRGLPYEQFTTTIDDKAFLAWFVRANDSVDSAAPVVVAFGGLGDGLSSWTRVQQYLYDHGVSSLAFEYGDLRDTVFYAKGKGRTSLEEMARVIPQLIDSVKPRMNGRSYKVYLLGHSLGCAVLTQYYHDLDTAQIGGVVLCSPFTSVRNITVEKGYFPKILSFLIPESVMNNRRYVRDIHRPLLLVHSRSDSVNSFAHGLSVFESANQPKRMVVLDHMSHNYIYKAQPDFWMPILNFIKHSGDSTTR